MPSQGYGESSEHVTCLGTTNQGLESDVLKTQKYSLFMNAIIVSVDLATSAS
jgi:hypothetical protein